MKRKKRIENILLNGLSSVAFKVEDTSILHQGHNNFNGHNETHFKIILHSKKIDSATRLSLHRKINELLKKEFSTGLHALEIKFKH